MAGFSSTKNDAQEKEKKSTFEIEKRNKVRKLDARKKKQINMANFILSHEDHGLNSPPEKRPRRTYDDCELDQLEAVFARCSYPDRAYRSRLAKEMGVSPKNIQIWFQNRRARARTLRRKADGVVVNPIERMRVQWSSTLTSTASKLNCIWQPAVEPSRCRAASSNINGESINHGDENIAPSSSSDNALNSSSTGNAGFVSDGNFQRRFSVSNLSDISNSSLDAIDDDLFTETFLTLFSPGFQSHANFDF